MARVNGPFNITGGIKGVSFYTMKGSDTVFMRTKGGPSKRRMKVGSEFELVRKHQVEWSACVFFSNSLNKVTYGFKKMGDYNVAPVWNGIGKKLMNLDTEREVGQRWLEFSKYPQVLEGFNMNRNFIFNAVFRANIQFELNKAANTLHVKIPRINTQNDLYNVRNLPYFRLHFSLGLMSDVYFNTELKYNPYKPFCEMFYAFSIKNDPEWLSANDLIPEKTIELQLPNNVMPQSKEHFSFLACVGIEFGNVGFAGQIEPVKNASAAKIVLAEKAV